MFALHKSLKQNFWEKPPNYDFPKKHHQMGVSYHIPGLIVQLSEAFNVLFWESCLSHTVVLPFKGIAHKELQKANKCTKIRPRNTNKD